MIDVSPGTRIRTLNDANKVVMTKVVSILIIDGNFTGTTIQTARATLTTTHDHPVYVQTQVAQGMAIPAVSVSKGDLVLGDGGIAMVLDAAKQNMRKKVLFVTEACTALTNGILTQLVILASIFCPQASNKTGSLLAISFPNSLSNDGVGNCPGGCRSEHCGDIGIAIKLA
eukprot:CAMPEP_0181315892 /NCGR_PEP_ID=MMETSP1101-20121128/15610_1 /TAXON_ID=46948 /ORGANISM="Rhodomonas abbreviata, Strain Caron Lab Isolate" /LENGTH=170 /DNA_ID=CAMNT_0023423115 /DNA_START=349 /DNA_END=858 /DNA_ORIENTATION=+